MQAHSPFTRRPHAGCAYRCDQCGHIWRHEKDNPDSPPTAVNGEGGEARSGFVVGHGHLSGPVIRLTQSV
jgi:hypothetical protein